MRQPHGDARDRQPQRCQGPRYPCPRECVLDLYRFRLRHHRGNVVKAHSPGYSCYPHAVPEKTQLAMCADPCQQPSPVYKGPEAFCDLLGPRKYLASALPALQDRRGKAQGDS